MERRKSFRYPASPERQPAQLVVAGRDCAAILLDESTGGFRICMDAPQIPDFSWEPDEELQLRTYSGWHDVRIVSHSQKREQVEFGMLRVRDHIEVPEGQAVNSARTNYRRTSASGIGSEYLIGLAIIFLVPLAPMLFQKFWAAVPSEEVITTDENPPSLDGNSSARKSPSVHHKRTTKARTTKTHSSVSKKRPASTTEQVSHFASGVSSSIDSLGETAEGLLEAGGHETRKLLRETQRIVHEIIASLTPGQKERLTIAVDAYTAVPNSENLDQVSHLLAGAEYSGLEQLVTAHEVDTIELTSLLYQELHR